MLAPVLYRPTDNLTISEAPNPRIGQFEVVQKRWSTNFETHKMSGRGLLIFFFFLHLPSSRLNRSKTRVLYIRSCKRLLKSNLSKKMS